MAETAEFIEEIPPAQAETVLPVPSMRRLRIAQVLAFVGLLAAAIGAVGPAERVRTTYSWPPATLPEGTPSSLWYTPLLLARRLPESLRASLPCSPPPGLSSSENSVTVLATARHPARVGGLDVARRGNRLVVSVGDNVLVRLPVIRGSAGDETCAYRLQIEGLRWSIEGGPKQVALGGGLHFVPVVNGVFSEVDLQSGSPPSVDITTFAHATRTIPRQTIAWVVAGLALAIALILVAVDRRPRKPWVVAKSLTRGALTHAHPADAVVGVVLIGWWLIAPSHWDDGWVMARQNGFSNSRGFSNYYDSLGANFPNGYWLEWLQHWLTQSSSTLVLLRLPALLCLAATWVLCRWILARVLASERAERVLLWVLASAFLTGALAWGMTLRPEPVTALLVTAVMACMVCFLERQTIAPLAVAATLVPLALTGHHAGVVVIAPILAIAPRLIHWGRARPAAATAIATTVFALVLVFAFVGSDIGQRSADAHLLGTYGIADAWYDEFRRYAYLSGGVRAGTPLRRGSFALIALAVLAFALRSRRERRPLLDFPAMTLGLSLLLFVFAPSKWPHHFGAILGIAAVAVASETARLRKELTWSRGSRARPFLAVAAAIVAIAWTWGPRESWTILDLRTLDWRFAFERQLSVSIVAAALPLVLLGWFVLAERTRGARRGLAPWRVACATVPVLVLPIVVFSAAVLVVDSTKTHSWTLARQNLAALRGDAGCGLADDILVAAPRSMRPLSPARTADTRSVPTWVPAAPVERLPRFGLGPAGEGSASSPWFHVPRARRFGLFVAGIPGATDQLMIEWGRVGKVGVELVDADAIPRSLVSRLAGVSPWRFVASEELESIEPETTAVRITLQSELAPGAALAVTTPVTYANESFRRRLVRDDSLVLVSPALLTYFPCAAQPRLHDGIADVPRYIVAPTDSSSPVMYGTSPFFGLLDIFPIDALSLADSRVFPENISIFKVDQRIPGAIQAPASSSTVRS